MKTLFLLCTLFFLSGFTRLDFNCLMLGTNAQEILRCYGEPYNICTLCNGQVAFEYIERISMNNELVYENHFFLTIKDGKLVKKSFCEENRPPFDLMYQEDPNYPSYP